MKSILGISAFYHDSAACIITCNKILVAAQEERFTREKHTSAFPINAIKFCLEYSGFTIEELDAVVFYDKPLLKFERLLETYYAFAPRGLRSFLKAMPVWAKEKIFLKKLIYDRLLEIEKFDKKKVTLLFSEHHLSHAASAFFPSPFEDSAILTIDGVGEWCTTGISHGIGSTITFYKEMHFPHSLGLLFSAFTYYLGFRVNSGEYKLMGLAPYGNVDSEEFRKFKVDIYNNLIDAKYDGSLWLNQEYFEYAVGLSMVNDKKWEKLFGFARRIPESSIESHHCNLALAIQRVTEDVIIRMAREAKRITKSRNLCLAGGVALNCVANGKLVALNLFENIFIQPAAGDAGGALGAALAVLYQYFHEDRIVSQEGADSMQGALLGPHVSDKEIELMARKNKAQFTRYETIEELTELVADKIAQSKVVGWFQGRAEFGPRALGNRSILADPRDPEMQKRINLDIKLREEFRPFAPAVLLEDAKEYFDSEVPSPYMLLVSTVKKEHRMNPDPDYDNKSLYDKLNIKRSTLNAITHVDYSARIQTVDRKANPLFYTLIETFKKKTNCPVLVNTSFNVRGEPIVNTPEDAYKCFIKSDMDLLVINNYVFDKKQP